MRLLILSQKLETLSLLFKNQTVHEYYLCSSPEQLFAAVRSFAPDMLLVEEEQLPEETPALLIAVRKRIAPRTYLVCLTRQNNLPTLCTYLTADALFHPDEEPAQIEALLKASQNREPFISPKLLPNPTPAQLMRQLSPREREILDLMGRGKRAADVARQLHLSEITVKNHRKNIKKKLGLTGSPARLSQFIKLYEITASRNSLNEEVKK